MSALYVWQVHELGEWGTVAIATDIGPVPVPLVTRRKDIATSPAFKDLARHHHETTGLPVRLARYDYAAVLEHIP